MSVRLSSLVLAVLGVILLAGVGVFKFLVLPGLMQLPADFSETQQVEGTMTALDPAAFAAGDLANLLTPEAPVSAERRLTVDATDGNTAIVTSAIAVALPQGGTQDDVHTYAIDRKTLGPVELTPEQIDSLVPADRRVSFEPHQGYAFGFPADLPKDGIAAYDPVLRKAVDLQFVEEKSVEGRTTYEMEIDDSGPVQNPAMKAGFAALPQALPRELVQGLLASGNVPEASRAAVEAAVPALPEFVTTSVIATSKGTLTIDTEFGAPLIADQEQGIYLAIDVAGSATPLVPLSVTDIHTLDSDIAPTAADLNSNGRTLALIGTWIPLGVGLLGVALLVVAGLRWRAPKTTDPVSKLDTVDA